MKKLCVLLVEAEALVRMPLAQYLRECGYQVLEATTLEEAQTLLSEGSQTIDIVLADVQTLGGGAFAFPAWARRNKPEVKVLSAGTIAGMARMAGNLCEEEPPIRKPYDHQLVLDRIRRLLAERDRNRNGLARWPSSSPDLAPIAAVEQRGRGR
jgi:DNA-binding response OmpR family regulator